MRGSRIAVAALLCIVVLTGCGARAAAPAPTVVQPGAPGEPARAAGTGAALQAGQRGYHPADVRFMQGMIPHHAQALVMTALVPARTSRAEVVALARRIERAQAEEIAMMEHWLVGHAGIGREQIPAHLEHHTRHAEGAGDARHPAGGSGHPTDRGADHPDRNEQHHGGHGADHGAHPGAAAAHPGAGPHGASPAPLAAGDPRHPPLHGMLSPAELAALAAANGPEFDRLFLTFMIRHHEGALAMVEELFAAGGGHTADMFQLVSHIDSDQRIEIARMYGLLATR
jgi:uncharacterized protein (DUF305 family)